MGTTFASELLRELNSNQIDQIFVQTRQLLDESVGISLDLSQLDMVSPDEETETIYETDEVQLVTYSDVTP